MKCRVNYDNDIVRTPRAYYKDSTKYYIIWSNYNQNIEYYNDIMIVIIL